MRRPQANKYRSALEVLQKGRDMLVDELADAVSVHGEDLLQSPFLLTEILEGHGTKLQFLMLLISQLERSAEDVDGFDPTLAEFHDESGHEPLQPRRKRRRRSRRRGRARGKENLHGQEAQSSSTEHHQGDLEF
jgi:hypothetical protein